MSSTPHAATRICGAFATSAESHFASGGTLHSQPLAWWGSIFVPTRLGMGIPVLIDKCACVDAVAAPSPARGSTQTGCPSTGAVRRRRHATCAPSGRATRSSTGRRTTALPRCRARTSAPVQPARHQ
eukprot:3512536-Prymnesium_polylepis.1